MSSNRLVFIADAGAAQPPKAGTKYIVVDTAWTPGPEARDDLATAIRTLLDRPEAEWEADRNRIRRLAAERFAQSVARARYRALVQSMFGPAATGQAVS